MIEKTNTSRNSISFKWWVELLKSYFASLCISIFGGESQIHQLQAKISTISSDVFTDSCILIFVVIALLIGIETYRAKKYTLNKYRNLAFLLNHNVCFDIVINILGVNGLHWLQMTISTINPTIFIHFFIATMSIVIDKIINKIKDE